MDLSRFSITRTKPCAALLVHGLPSTPAEMQPLAGVIGTLADRGYNEWIEAVQVAAHELKGEHHQANIVHGLILFAPFWKLNHILWRLFPSLRLSNNPGRRESIHSFHIPVIETT